MEIGLERPARAQQRPRRFPPRIAAVQVEEIPREPARPPQLLRMVIRRGDEFNMLEEEEATTKVKRLRADLSAMIGQI